MKFAVLKNTFKKSSSVVLSLIMAQTIIAGNFSLSASFADAAEDGIIRPITEEDAQLIHDGKITLENGTADSLLIKRDVLNPDEDSDGDGLKNNEELFTITKNGKKYLYYKTHPLLKDTDGDGIDDKEDESPLKWNVDTRDAILFQELSYRDDDYARSVLDDTFSSVVNYKNRNEYTLMHNELAPYWELEKTWHLDNGFDASLFKFSNKRLPFLEDGQTHVLAIRGTSGPGDMKADTALSSGLWPKQATSALELADEINAAGYKNVYVTGHSLGGYLSQIFFVRSVGEKYGNPETNSMHKNLNRRDKNKLNNENVKGLFTFNAPKIKHNLFTPWSGEYADLGDYLTEVYGSKHYTVDNDSVTRATGAFKGYINLEASANGHSSRSFFEDRYIDQDGFSIGERRGLEGYGFQDENMKDLFFVKPAEDITDTEKPDSGETEDVEDKEEPEVHNESINDMILDITNSDIAEHLNSKNESAESEGTVDTATLRNQVQENLNNAFLDGLRF